MMRLQCIILCLLILSVTHSVFGVANAEPLSSQVIKPSQFVKRQVGGGKAIIEIFKEGKEAFVGRLYLAPNATVPKHRDPTEEYLIIESGSGEITIDGVKQQIKQGDVIYMSAHAEVSFKNGSLPLVALQVFSGPQSARKYDQWTPISPKRHDSR